MSCALLCVGASKSSEESTARRDSAGRLLCERCSRQLTKVKHKRPHGPGYACSPRCKPSKRGASVLDPDAAAPAAAAAAAPQPKRRRTASDPGEPLPLQPRTQAITRRIALPAPSTQKKQRTTRQDEKIAQQLEETHARRMAALATPGAAPSLPAAALATEEEKEWAARTPAQRARRHYLQHVAPRCERCNFPRTGRKGWNESEGCHTDKNCNEDRWRTIDAFC
jgi:hypothetical protein